MHPNSPRSGCRRALKARHEWCQFATLPPARAVVYERFTTGRAARSQKRMGLMDGGGRQLIQKSRLHGISTQARTGISTEARSPNMQRIAGNGIALHGWPLPGYAASHGCVRMPYDFAEKLFDKTRIGMRVIISPLDAEPVDFTDKLLFQPNADALAAAPARAETAVREAADAAKAADDAKKASLSATRDTASLSMAVRKLELA